MSSTIVFDPLRTVKDIQTHLLSDEDIDIADTRRKLKQCYIKLKEAMVFDESIGEAWHIFNADVGLLQDREDQLIATNSLKKTALAATGILGTGLAFWYSSPIWGTALAIATVYGIYKYCLSSPKDNLASFGSQEKLSLPPFKTYFSDPTVWIRIKEEPLGSTNFLACRQFLDGTLTDYPPYLQDLIDVFRSQMSIRNGTSGQMTLPLIDQRAYPLIRHFLKQKCHCINPLSFDLVRQGETLADKAQFDPHFHMNSFYVVKNPQSRDILPNFDLAYPIINPLAHSSDPSWSPASCLATVTEQLSAPHAPRVTEVQSFQPDMIRSLFSGLKNRLRVISGHLRNSSYPPSTLDAYDVCGVDQQSYGSLRTFLDAMGTARKTTRIHMGETPNPEDGRQHVDNLLKESARYPSVPPLRIGHGTHASIEAMNEIAKRGYYVEACLSSNKKTGVLSKRSDYPLSLMLLLGVKVVIGTDGAPLYSTSLALEYTHALKSIRKFQQKMKYSSDIVQTPSGQELQFKDIHHLVKPSCKEPDANPVRYRDLATHLKDDVLARLSENTLIRNAQELLADSR